MVYSAVRFVVFWMMARLGICLNNASVFNVRGSSAEWNSYSTRGALRWWVETTVQVRWEA